MQMDKLGGRAWTWLYFVPATAASILFSIVSLVTFANLAQVQYEESAGDLGSQLDGALAATFMAPVLTSLLVIISFFVLVKKTWSKSGAGFTYGFCTSAFFIMCPFLLLTGIVLTGNKHHTSTFEASPRGVWTTSSTNAFVATYVLAFISAVFDLILPVTMVTNRRSFGAAQITVDELGLSDRLRGGTSPMSTPMAGAPAAPFTESTRPAAAGGAWNAV